MYTKNLIFILLCLNLIQICFSGNLSLPGNQSLDVADYSFAILTKNQTFEKTFYFSFETSATDFTIEYWVENNNSEIVKTRINTTNKNQKQFTPKDDSSTYSLRAIIYAFNFTNSQNMTFSKLSLPSLPGLPDAPDNLSGSNNNSTIINEDCDFLFETQIMHNISKSTIYYKFKTNATNYTITYWIEDYLGNVAKEPLETTNTNQKQFTPKALTNIFYIKSKLLTSSCTLNSSKMAIFYSPDTYGPKTIKTEPKESATKVSNQETTSKIEIININDIISQKTSELAYEIYRGDTNKRVVYIFLNNKKIGSAELPKYTNLKGRILLNPENGANNLTITGIDSTEQLIFHINKTLSETVEKNVETPKKQSGFHISGYSVSNSTLLFELQFPDYEITSECYITYIRTKMSETLNHEKFKNKTTFSLTINNTKLKQKQELAEYPLQLICRYKKPQNANYAYESAYFNYTINDEKDVSAKVNMSQITSIYTEKTLFEPAIIGIQQSQDKTTIASENYETGQNSFYFIFLGSTLILSALILRW